MHAGREFIGLSYVREYESMESLVLKSAAVRSLLFSFQRERILFLMWFMKKWITHFLFPSDLMHGYENNAESAVCTADSLEHQHKDQCILCKLVPL